MRNFCVVTGTRAEYGLLYWLMKAINEDKELNLQLLVTGMHLSPEFGLTWNQIEKDGFPIARKIEMLLSSDTSVGISKSMGLAQISFAEAFDQLKPDLLILLGDRSEILSAANAALMASIPIAHLHGGELSEGAYDDAIRHSITKMSHLHFTSCETYRSRVIQLGEQPDTVFNVGALALDSITKLPLLNKASFERSIDKKLSVNNLLITFHPVTLESNSAKKQFSELLKALDELENTLLVFTYPNSDKDGRVIIEMINNYVITNPKKAKAFTTLGQQRYLSAIQLMDAVVGNSSSGIVEAPAFNKPTVNIGDRQRGRIHGSTIINCKPVKEEISEAINKAFKFDTSIKHIHEYGDGNASARILKILKNSTDINIKKTFFDMQNSVK